jgi:hypothetical protein
MPSPFPGMNPYLERDIAWHDFHERFIILGAGIPGAQVRPNHVVKVDDHIFVHELVDVTREAYLEIRDRHSQEVVTVLELLSPSNKRSGGTDRAQYLAKRREILNSQAHFVEIDLLRGGEPMPGEDQPAFCYSALVSRVEERPEAGFWPIGLREGLPVIPIPLRAPHRDAILDLQELLHRVYDEAGYEFYVYNAPPQPPLEADEDAWARQYVPPGA